MKEEIVILCEPLTVREEADFLLMVNEEQEAGEISAEDAAWIIDREYELMALAK